MRWVCVLLVAACAATPGKRLQRRGDEIVVCGQLFHTGARVVTWLDPGGYDAYRPGKHGTPFGDRRGLPPAVAERVAERGWALGDLQTVVSQVVVHYDVAGTSCQCFHVLHEGRGLSCHFLLDVDGTIYQTLDLKERAWHAGSANDRSVGIEIAQIGAYGEREKAVAWYRDDGTLALPPAIRRGALKGEFRSARAEPVQGEIHGAPLWQQDYTDAQYEALARLLAALSRALPRIRLEAPRDPSGAVLPTTLGDADARAFRGVVGHYHLTRGKVDPGPAFDWDRVLRRARSLAR